MDEDKCMLPEHPLQSYCLQNLVRELPRMIDDGFLELERHQAGPFLQEALSLYASPLFGPPALQTHQVFSALRYTEFPSLDFCALEKFGILSPDHVCKIVSSLLVAHSQQCPLEDISVTTSNLSSPRALELFHKLVKGASELGSLRNLSILGSGISANYLKHGYVRDVFEDLQCDIRVLRLSGLHTITDANILPLIQAAGSNLVELDISVTGVTGSGLSAILVSPESCDIPLPKGFLQEEESISANCFSSRAVGIRDSLEVLDVSRTLVHSTDLICLIGMKSLSDLRIGYTPAVGFATNSCNRRMDKAELSSMLSSVISTSSLPKLRRLDLSGAEIYFAAVLEGVHYLEELVLIQGVIDDEDGNFSPRLPPRLQRLDLSNTICRGFLMSNFASSIAKRCGHTLERLQLTGATMYGWYGRGSDRNPHADELVRSAFDGMTALRHLDISESHHLSTGAMAAILLSKCGNGLTKLRLTDVNRPKLVGLLKTERPQLQFPALRDINISESEISEERAELLWFLAACEGGHTGLETVRVHRMSAVDDIVASRIMYQSAPTLRRLDLAEDRLTNDFLRNTKVLLPNLYDMDVYRCRHIDVNELISFCSSYAPRIEAVYFRHPDTRPEPSASSAARTHLPGAGLAWHRAKLGADLVNKARVDANSLPEWRQNAHMASRRQA